MKKDYFIYVMFFFGALFTACSSSDDEDGTGAVGNIVVYLPDDLEEIDLDYKAQNKKIDFEWEEVEGEGVEYSLVFSLSEEMDNVQAKDVDYNTSFSITHLEFDDLLAKMGVGEYKRGTVYWLVEATTSKGKVRSEVRSMNVFRFYKPFIDPRDNEEYRVCRVVDIASGNYAVWLADNIRAKVYSDGTAIDNDKMLFHSDESNPDLVKAIGGYYTWTVVMRGTVGAEEGEKIQGIAPVGWHIPTKIEWDFLINNCGDSTIPGTELKDNKMWDPSATDIGRNSIGFNIIGTGYVWSLPENTPIEIGANTYFWTSTVPKAGDVYPWDPSPELFPNQGVTYGFMANDPGAALYPYDRTRGFSVRCVLD